MNNVWFIPSVAALMLWLKKCDFTDIRCVDTDVTALAEQRRTDWMPNESLVEYLDPNDITKTIERLRTETCNDYCSEKSAESRFELRHDTLRHVKTMSSHTMRVTAPLPMPKTLFTASLFGWCLLSSIGAASAAPKYAC